MFYNLSLSFYLYIQLLCVCMFSCVWLCATPWIAALEGPFVHGISQAKILEWIAISFSRGSSWPREWTYISWVSCTGGQVLYHWATWWGKPFNYHTDTIKHMHILLTQHFYSKSLLYVKKKKNQWKLNYLLQLQNLSNLLKYFVFALSYSRKDSSVQSLSHVQPFAAPRTAAWQVSLSITNSRSLLKLTSIKLVMPSNHLILSRPLLLPSIFSSIRVFSNESVLCIRWPKY